MRGRLGAMAFLALALGAIPPAYGADDVKFDEIVIAKTTDAAQSDAMVKAMKAFYGFGIRATRVC